jgi:hypothetical protein
MPTKSPLLNNSIQSVKAIASKKRATKAIVMSMQDLMLSCINSTACRSKKSLSSWSDAQA